MAQTTTKEVTINSVMREPAFQQGMTDYHSGKEIPLRLPVDAEWHYERGRLFAAATGARYIHLERGKVKPAQQYAFSKLIKERIIL